MQAYIPSEKRLKEIVEDTVLSVIKDCLPQVLRRAKRKEWMTSEEAKEFLGLNNRQLQYLRDQRKIPFSQSGRKIFYPTNGLENWLKENMPKRWDELMRGQDLDSAA